jgi:hypothetical protein
LKRAILSLVALFSLAAAPLAHAQQVEIPEETYVQAASGMAFPVTLGRFERINSVTRYSPDGSDESVGYQWETKVGTVSATVYVYPSPTLSSASAANGSVDQARRELCDAQFAGILREIATVHPTATLIEDEPTTLQQRGVRFPGRKLAFTISSPSAFGKSHAPLRSEASLFCYVGGRWTVKYRFTYPAAVRAGRAIATFMRDLTWTITPETL